MRQKVYRNFGPIRVFSGKEVKVIRPEEGLRINPTTGEVILDEEGNAEVAK